jgi:inner membrane protein
MIGESHAVLGAVSTATVLVATGHSPMTAEAWPHFLLAVGLGALVGLLPDIDSPNTLIRQIFGLGSRQAWNNLKRWPYQNIFVNLFNVVRFVLSLLLNVLAKLLPHRGPTHWLIVAVALTALMYWAVWWYYWPDRIWLAFFTGYVSHLVGDSVTIRGVKLFAPFYNKSVGLPVRWLRVRTGSKGEFVMLAVMVLPMVVWLFFW